MLSFLAPKFLKQLDNRLLLNSPILWISKLYYVIYYSIILWLLTSLIAFVIPINLADLVSTGIYYTLFTIISIILLCVWIYKNSIFNIESTYGNRSIMDEYKVFFIYFVCVFLLFSFAYPFAYIYNFRIANALSDTELVNEINTLNLGEAFFVRSYYDYDGIQYTKEDSLNKAKQDSLNGVEGNYYASTYYYKYDINRYHNWYKYTPYSLLVDSDKVEGLLNSAELRRNFERIRKDEGEALQAIQNYLNVLKKHDVYMDGQPGFIYSRYRSLCQSSPIEAGDEYYETPLKSSYSDDSYKLDSILRNVCDAKYSDVFVLKWQFNLAMFYFVFYIVVFFMMFRTVRWQQFLVTMVSIILIPILLFIFGMLLSYGGGRSFETYFNTMLILVYLVALSFAIAFFVKPNKFNAFKSICMQIVYLCTPVLFLFVLAYIDNTTDVFWKNYYMYAYNDYYPAVAEQVNSSANTVSKINYEQILNEQTYKYYRELYDNWVWGTMIFGIVFHVSFFMVFMKERFLKMKALPKNY